MALVSDGIIEGAFVLPKTPDYKWIPEWLNEKGLPLATIRWSVGLDTIFLRVPYGTEQMSFLELPMAMTTLQAFTPERTKQWIESWLVQNGVHLKSLSEAEMEAELKPIKKRIRMGKWGIKREFIKG